MPAISKTTGELEEHWVKVFIVHLAMLFVISHNFSFEK